MLGSEAVTDYVCGGMTEDYGACFAFEPDPLKAAHLMIDQIDRKRADLGLPPPMYEVPYAPKTADAMPKAQAAPAGEVMAVAAGSCPGATRIED